MEAPEPHHVAAAGTPAPLLRRVFFLILIKGPGGRSAGGEPKASLDRSDRSGAR